MTQPKTVSIGTISEGILEFIGHQATMRGSSFAGMCRFILVDYVQNHPDYLNYTPQNAISPTPNPVEETAPSEPAPSINDDNDNDNDLDYNPF